MVDLPSDVAFLTRLDLVRSTMLPSELSVVDFMQSHADFVVESKVQDVAEAVGVARSTVIRTCQTLGYTGYTQLRVALARESPSAAIEHSPDDSGPTGIVRARLDEVAIATRSAASALTDAQLDDVVRTLASARRIICAANGFSTAVAMDLGMRLAAMGLSAEFVADHVAQQFTVAQLTEEDCCVLVSASGQNEATLRVGRVAREAGATVIALCSFPRSPLAEIAHHTVLVVPSHGSFRDELEQTSRVVHAAIAEALVALVVDHLGEEEVRRRRSRLIEVIGTNLVD